MMVHNLRGLGAEGGGGDVATSVATIDAVMNEAASVAASTGSSWADALQSILPTLALTYQQKRILDVQAQRMRAGLAPLDASQYGVGVSVGLSPDVQKWLLFGGAALLAAILLPRLIRAAR
jgi:hypothetical protein